MSSVRMARLALVGIAAVVALPSPLSTYWGGRTEGSPLPVLLIAALAMGLTLWVSREREGAHLWVDVATLTGLLSVGGAAQNPFSMLYFVPIMLASVVAERLTWRIVALALFGFALLLLQTTLALLPRSSSPHHAHFFHHVVGMAIALAVAGAFISFFVHRVGRSLERQRLELRLLERQQREDRFAVSLGALAAGAAHELGTPLGTIQLLAEEFPHLSAEQQPQASAGVLEQVARMKEILHGLASSELSAEILKKRSPWSAEQLAEQLGDLLSGVDYLVQPGTSTQPLASIAQIARELLRNAIEADASRRISLQVEFDERELRLAVTDHGHGLNAEQLELAPSPFYSGRGGTGLGLFLATVHARQLGGELQLQSAAAAGTVATLRLPKDFAINVQQMTDHTR